MCASIANHFKVQLACRGKTKNQGKWGFSALIAAYLGEDNSEKNSSPKAKLGRAGPVREDI